MKKDDRFFYDQEAFNEMMRLILSTPIISKLDLPELDIEMHNWTILSNKEPDGKTS
jgi:hypothetical protein